MLLYTIATHTQPIEGIVRENAQKIDVNTHYIEQIAKLSNDYGVPITIAIIVMFLGVAYVLFSLREAKVERKADREFRQKDHDERIRMNDIRMQREDANTQFWHEALQKMTEVVTKSTLTAENVERTLATTAQMHVDLDKEVQCISARVECMAKDVIVVKESVGDNQKVIETLAGIDKGLSRMERKVAELIVYIKKGDEKGDL